MRTLSLWSLILVLVAIGPLTAQDEIFIDSFDTGATAAWSAEISPCTQFFKGQSRGVKCYEWLQGTGDWFESQLGCSRWAPGGRLVSIEESQEWGFLGTHLPPASSDSWIGLSRGVQDECPGAWSWESGEPMTFDDWDAGQPDQGSCPACAASWKDRQRRWDDIACDASGLVSDAICEVDLTDVRIVGKNGGRFVFSNGAVLEVPANAVASDTAIGLRPIDCAEVGPYLNARPINSHEKECLAAFDISPPDLTLAKVATLELQFPGKEWYEIPVLLEIFPETSDYAYRPTDISYEPSTETIEVEISSAAKYAVAILTESANIPPNQAPTDKSPEALCEEGRIGVRSEFVDLDVAHGDVECTLIVDTVSVTFLDCEGAPTFDADMAESVGCSEDTYFLGRICGPNVSGESCFANPQPATRVDSFGWARLHTWMKAIDPNQNNRELFIANIDHASYRWGSNNEVLVQFPDDEDGLLVAGECPEESCPVEVNVWNRYVSSPHPKGTVIVGPESPNPYGIYDIEWAFTFDGSGECSYSVPQVSRGSERGSMDGTWSGKAAFDIRSELDWSLLSYEADGLISTTHHGEYSNFCRRDDDTTYWTDWQSSQFVSLYPQSTCVLSAPSVRLSESDSLMIYWPCSDFYLKHSWVASGWQCETPVEPSGSDEFLTTVEIFENGLEIPQVTSGVFETEDVLYMSQNLCQDDSYLVDVVVEIRAVRRLPP